MRMLPRCARAGSWIGTALLATGFAFAEDPVEKVESPWPVAEILLEAPEDAEVALTIGSGPAARELRVGAGTAYVVTRPGTLDAKGAAALDPRTVVDRLPAALAELRAVPAGGGAVALFPTPTQRPALREVLPTLISGPGLELRVLVRPASLATDPPAEAGPAPRVTWSGSEMEYFHFVEREAARWDAAYADVRTYQPSRDALALAPVARGEGTKREWAVLEVPPEGERFGGADLVSAVASRDAHGRPCVMLEVRKERQAAFAAFTARNVGLPLALVLDGVVLFAPVIREPLRDRVQITLVNQDMGQEGLVARRLAAALGGPLDVVAVLEPATPGRRRLRVPWDGASDLPVVVHVPGAAARTMVVRPTVAHVLGIERVAEALLAARATGRLREDWADRQWMSVTRLDMGKVLLDLARRAESDELARADALELAGLLDPADPLVLEALEQAAKSGTPYVASAARFVRSRAANTSR